MINRLRLALEAAGFMKTAALGAFGISNPTSTEDQRRANRRNVLMSFGPLPAGMSRRTRARVAPVRLKSRPTILAGKWKE